jgi:hypothetical protein
MSITNGYCTLPELKVRLDITDTEDDDTLEAVIEAVSRQIDGWCGRFFYAADEETRYYTAERNDYLIVDDIQAVTGSVTSIMTDADGDRTYEDTWATTDYDLMPYNAANSDVPVYTYIMPSPAGNYVFPTMPKGVQIIADFGFDAVPKIIKEACLLQAARIYKRKDAPFGVTANAITGKMMEIDRIDGDVQLLIERFKRYV